MDHWADANWSAELFAGELVALMDGLLLDDLVHTQVILQYHALHGMGIGASSREA